jgi:hypothetical protein
MILPKKTPRAGSGSTALEERHTKRPTPCFFIAAITFLVPSEKRVVGLRPSFRPLPTETLVITAFWPSTSASRDSGRITSASATRRRSWRHGSADGLRAAAVTSHPLSSALPTMILPVPPVDPKMATFISLTVPTNICSVREHKTLSRKPLQSG